MHNNNLTKCEATLYLCRKNNSIISWKPQTLIAGIPYNDAVVSTNVAGRWCILKLMSVTYNIWATYCKQLSLHIKFMSKLTARPKVYKACLMNLIKCPRYFLHQLPVIKIINYTTVELFICSGTKINPGYNSNYCCHVCIYNVTHVIKSIGWKVLTSLKAAYCVKLGIQDHWQKCENNECKCHSHSTFM